jgi:FkbM family methyltransferase
MASDLKIKLGNFLFKNLFAVYKPMYTAFKIKQDAFEIKLLKKYIKPGDTIIDIGSNIGFYALLLSELAGEKGHVHCFEPDAVNFKHLQSATAQLKNVSINHKAIGPTTEKIKIYTSKELNVDHRTYEPEDYDEVIEIDAVNLDDYLMRTDGGKIPKVNFIKMDIQGFEMQAIKGMQRTLTENKDLKLISEFWPYGLHKAGSSSLEYFDHLLSLQFTCYLFENETLVKLDTKKVNELDKYKEDKTHYYNILATRGNV